jgi:hypothetical protein
VHSEANARNHRNLTDRILERPCPTCRLDTIEGALLADFPELRPVEPWKYGHLYQCSNCGRQWFLHEHKQRISRIHDQLLPLAHHWNQHHLVIEPGILNTLASIGGVADYYNDTIAIPCTVKDVIGNVQEKAIVLVSRQPPYFWYKPQAVHWADAMRSAGPSPFALPLDVRRATAHKSEESMGFAPVGIVDGRGNEYTLTSVSRLFDWNGIRGEEIRLSGRQDKWRKTVQAESAEAFYFIDWFDQCEELLT